MKNILFILIFWFTVLACRNGDNKVTDADSPETMQPDDLKKTLEDSANFTSMQWLDSTYQDLGKVEEGQIVDVAFRFKNIGAKPLIIRGVSVSCGCTTISDKPTEPYSTGQEGIIKAKFDSKNMAGERLREIYVSANTMQDTSHILVFRVEVIKSN